MSFADELTQLRTRSAAHLRPVNRRSFMHQSDPTRAEVIP